jgi:hypothetical protein
MAHVICEVSNGLRASERTVAVRDVDGFGQFLRVESDFLTTTQQGKTYLPVGVVHMSADRILIELPHEADSGINRLWVRKVDLLES